MVEAATGELYVGPMEGTFRRVAFSLDGGEPLTPYEHVDGYGEPAWELARDMSKRSRAPERLDFDPLTYLEQFETKLVVPYAVGESYAELEAPQKSSLPLEDTVFYFTPRGFEEIVGSEEKLQKAMDAAPEGAITKLYEDAEVTVSSITDPERVRYRDENQIAVPADILDQYETPGVAGGARANNNPGGGETATMSDNDPLPAVPKGWRPPQMETSFGSQYQTVEELFTDNSGISTPARDGISGIYSPDTNVMIVDPRRTHHNVQLSNLNQTDRMGLLGDMFSPWVWDVLNFGDGPPSAELDFPRSAGGAFQYTSRNDIQPDYVRSGDKFTESDAYAVAWAAKRLGVPGETRTEIQFLPESIASDAKEMSEQLNFEFNVRRESRPLADFYRELDFAGQLPTPILDRPYDVQYKSKG